MKPGLNRFTMKNFACHQLIQHTSLWPLSAEAFTGMYPAATPAVTRNIGRGNGKSSEQFEGWDD